MYLRPSRKPERSGEPSFWYLASTDPSKPSVVVNTGLPNTKTSERSGIPAITGCVGSVVTCMIEPPVKYSVRGSPATTLRTGSRSALIAPVVP